MRRAILILMLMLLAPVLSGCDLLDEDQGATPALEIQTLTTAIGAMDETGDQQVLSYSITLANNGSVPIYVQEIEPLLAPDFNSLVLAETLFVPVETTLEASDVALIESEILFDAQGLSKAALGELSPYLDGMRVTTVRVLELPPAAARLSRNIFGEMT